MSKYKYSTVYRNDTVPPLEKKKKNEEKSNKWPKQHNWCVMSRKASSDLRKTSGTIYDGQIKEKNKGTEKCNVSL